MVRTLIITSARALVTKFMHNITYSLRFIILAVLTIYIYTMRTRAHTHIYLCLDT